MPSNTLLSPQRNAILPPILPRSPYYNALTSAYVTRAASTDSLIVVDTSTKKKRTKKATRAECKRREKEEHEKSMLNKDRWWEKDRATVAGEDLISGSHQDFLANNVDGYTGVYKQRFVDRPGGHAISGDYHSTPRRVAKLLMNSTYKDLNIMDRSADFRNEVGWRLHLRTSTPSQYQLRQFERTRKLRQREEEIANARRRNNVRHVVVDTVGHLLNFSTEVTEDQAKKEAREKLMVESEKARREIEKEDAVNEAVEYVKHSLGGTRRQFLSPILI
ncbi:hypothetical protein TL16_g03711 [Triparma laevis f. inornata]|uniref:Uncharacterized protein n=2 Tax=Triparma laevis TaxID=1534972 RepID=A0A9W7FKS5_9STRA|nr:hypothetical protein TL16_g03711 [Triparma laevis f. inornata]GMI13855.1 hypothetical protein TrLO_g949 [Triparma laevis f. longispina]